MATRASMIQELAERLGSETTVEQAEKAFEWLDNKFEIMQRIDLIEISVFLRDEVSDDEWNDMCKAIGG